MLTDGQVTKFQSLYKNHFGTEISREDAIEGGIKLVRLMSIIYSPITKRDYFELQKRRKKHTNQLE